MPTSRVRRAEIGVPGCGPIPYRNLLERIAKSANFQGWPFPVATVPELGVSGSGPIPYRNLLERSAKSASIQGWPFSGGRRAEIRPPGFGPAPCRNLADKEAKEPWRSHAGPTRHMRSRARSLYWVFTYSQHQSTLSQQSVNIQSTCSQHPSNTIRFILPAPHEAS